MTSGSTGRSKGVIHSEAALKYAVEQQIAAAELARHDPVGIIVPLSAAPAFTFGVYLSLVLRASAVMSRGWDPVAAVNRLASTDVRWTMCVPTQVLQLAAAAGETDRPLRRMRAITVGGGPMRLEAMLDAEARLGVTLLRVFGLSECLGHTTPRLGEPAELRLSRDGRPFPGTTVRILDEEGRPVPAGTPGRAQVRGPSLFLGYAEAGRLQPAELTPDGFLDTGDLIVSYPDGMLKVSGRIKDTVIRGGRNLSVAEIEEALADDPRIEQACAVPVPDRVLGERVAALVVPRADGLTLKEILAGLQDRGVAKATWPEYVVLAERLPMTAVGKVSRAEARATVMRELRLEEGS
jgi:non-ribosomal peptide synthetase component E (peptide arylation enzyme)